LLLGIVPGVLFALHHHKNQTWDKSNPEGLSLLTSKMASEIRKTKVPERSSRFEYFFKPLPEIFVNDINSATDNSLNDPKTLR